METKQTAVEWLVKNSYTFQVEIEAGNEHLKSKINQAKQMEKEQISRGYQEGLIDGMNHSPKDYYNETYGKDNENNN
jgi:hypothetical protein